jgi:hypothetical protein
MTGHEKRLFRIEVVLSIAIVRPESITMSGLDLVLGRQRPAGYER